MYKKLRSALLLLSIFAISSCNGGGSSNTNVQPSVNDGYKSTLEIPSSGDIFLLNNQNTQVTIPVFNNGNSELENIKYSVSSDNADLLPQVLLENEDCSSIAAHGYCLLNVVIHSLPEKSEQGSFVLHADNAEFTSSQIINYRDHDVVSEQPFLSAPTDLTLPAAKAHSVVWAYNLSATTSYEVNSLSVSGAATLSGASSFTLATNSITPLIMDINAQDGSSVKVSADYEAMPNSTTQLNATMGATLSAAFTVTATNGAILMSGNIPVLNTYISESSVFTVYNSGNTAATISAITPGTNLSLITTPADRCQVGTLAAGASCKIYYRVTGSISAGGASNITISSNAASGSTFTANVGWYNSKNYAIAGLKFNINPYVTNTQNFTMGFVLQNIGGFPITGGTLTVASASSNVTATVASTANCANNGAIVINGTCNGTLSITNSSATSRTGLMVQLKYAYTANGVARTQYFNFYFDYVDNFFYIGGAGGAVIRQVGNSFTNAVYGAVSTTAYTAGERIRKAIWSSGISRFFAVGDGGILYQSTSATGANYMRIPVNVFDNSTDPKGLAFRSIAANDTGTTMVIASGGGRTFRSTDSGATWTGYSTGLSNDFYGSTYFSNVGKFVLIGDSVIATSTTGVFDNTATYQYINTESEVFSLRAVACTASACLAVGGVTKDGMTKGAAFRIANTLTEWVRVNYTSPPSCTFSAVINKTASSGYFLACDSGAIYNANSAPDTAPTQLTIGSASEPPSQVYDFVDTDYSVGGGVWKGICGNNRGAYMVSDSSSGLQAAVGLTPTYMASGAWNSTSNYTAGVDARGAFYNGNTNVFRQIAVLSNSSFSGFGEDILGSAFNPTASYQILYLVGKGFINHINTKAGGNAYTEYIDTGSGDFSNTTFRAISCVDTNGGNRTYATCLAAGGSTSGGSVWQASNSSSDTAPSTTKTFTNQVTDSSTTSYNDIDCKTINGTYYHCEAVGNNGRIFSKYADGTAKISYEQTVTCGATTNFTGVWIESAPSASHTGISFYASADDGKVYYYSNGTCTSTQVSGQPLRALKGYKLAGASNQRVFAVSDSTVYAKTTASNASWTSTTFSVPNLSSYKLNGIAGYTNLTTGVTSQVYFLGDRGLVVTTQDGLNFNVNPFSNAPFSSINIMQEGEGFRILSRIVV